MRGAQSQEMAECTTLWKESGDGREWHDEARQELLSGVPRGEASGV
jgi:hypothetical protein